MSARERECGELPSPELSLFHRKVGQGLFVLCESLCSRDFSAKLPTAEKSLKPDANPPMNSQQMAEWIPPDASAMIALQAGVY
jgi:hypothetical protein